MSIFPWKNNYSVYVEAIDEQHKKLVNILNELVDGMMNKKTQEIVQPALDQLVDYASYHFKEEEEYFDKIDYPEAEEHRKEHEQLIGNVLKFKADYENNKTGLTVELMKFLKAWLTDHICGTDKELGKLLYKNGIQ